MHYYIKLIVSTIFNAIIDFNSHQYEIYILKNEVFIISEKNSRAYIDKFVGMF